MLRDILPALRVRGQRGRAPSLFAVRDAPIAPRQNRLVLLGTTEHLAHRDTAIEKTGE